MYTEETDQGVEDENVEKDRTHGKQHYRAIRIHQDNEKW